MNQPKCRWLYALIRAVIPGVAISGAIVLFSTEPASTLSLENVKKVSTTIASEITPRSGDDVGSLQFGGGVFGQFGEEFVGGQFGGQFGNFGDRFGEDSEDEDTDDN